MQDKSASSSSESSSDEEEPDEIPVHIIKKRIIPRNSVSAEAYGEWNKKEAFAPKVIAKTGDTITRMKELLKKVFMFQNLEMKDVDVIVNAMEEVVVKPGDAVIKQNDEGNCLYVVDSGVLTCTKLFVRVDC